TAGSRPAPGRRLSASPRLLGPGLRRDDGWLSLPPENPLQPPQPPPRPSLQPGHGVELAVLARLRSRNEPLNGHVVTRTCRPGELPGFPIDGDGHQLQRGHPVGWSDVALVVIRHHPAPHRRRHTATPGRSGDALTLVESDPDG